MAAALVGTTIEFYDFFVYANAAALVFARQFFPQGSSMAQFGAWATFAMAFFARPLGGVLFGHVGDRRGTRTGLCGSFLLMGTATLAIGLLPTFEMIGWGATVLLCLLRLLQGLGLGGEWGGAIVLAVEGAPLRRKVFYGMVPQLGAPLGLLFANGTFLILDRQLSPAAFDAWGWRLPFLASAPLIVLGLWVRRALRIAGPRETSSPPFTPLLEVTQRCLPLVVAGMAAATLGYVLFYLCSTYALARAAPSLGLSRQAILTGQMGMAIAMALGVVSGTLLSVRSGAPAVLCVVAAISALIGLCLPTVAAVIVSPESLASALCLAMFVMGLAYGPIGGWLASLYPPHLRYTAVALALNVAGVLGGGCTPLVAEYLASQNGLATFGTYVSAVAVMALAATAYGSRHLRSTRPKRANLTTHQSR